MKEFTALLDYIGTYIQLTQEEENQFIALLKLVRIKKRQYIVQPGFVCQYRSFIVQGTMRTYLVDAKGQEHTMAFGIENWWIMDFSSFIFQEPATLFVEALEDTTLIQISFEAEQQLLEKIPKFEKFYRIISQRGYAFQQKRILQNLSLTAEERYEEFVTKYPVILQRVPQYMLATYLGVSKQFLSKIRNNRAKS